MHTCSSKSFTTKLWKDKTSDMIHQNDQLIEFDSFKYISFYCGTEELMTGN